jgi:hypothetical protein
MQFYHSGEKSGDSGMPPRSLPRAWSEMMFKGQGQVGKAKTDWLVATHEPLELVAELVDSVLDEEARDCDSRL